MKVLLVEPPLSPFDVPSGLVGLPEPLAMETVAAKIYEHHDVTILDMRLEPDKLDEYLQKEKPDIVGTGAVTANLHLSKGILKRTKEICPHARTLIGGHHVTFLPQDANEPFIDVIVIGEGDYSAARVIDAFEHNQSLIGIPGLVINHDGQQIRTSKAALANMDDLPYPARKLVARYRNNYFQRTYRPIISINTSRGCPHRCSFCMLWKMNDGKYRFRSAKLIAEEISQFKEEFVDFIDDNSIENVHHANELADLMIKTNLNKKFKVYGRSDTIARNPGMIEKLAEAGLKIVLVGFETIKNDDLIKWKKKSNLEMNDKAIKLLQKNGIDITSYFVVDPSFDEKDFIDLGAYIDSMGLKDPVFTILVPLPGTDIFEKEPEKIVSKDYRIFDFFHTVFKTKLPLDEFYHQFSLLYKNAYSESRLLKLAPKGFPKTEIEAHAKRFEIIYNRIQNLKSHHHHELQRI